MSADLAHIAAARRGDRAAQRQLFEAWYPYALTVMLHYAPCRADAEELTMDGFVRLYRKLDKFDEQRPFRPWFRRLLVRVALDALRGHLRPNFYENNPPLPLQSVHNDALRSLSRIDVIELLQRLPTSYRLTFNLFVLEDYTHKEVAEQLGISINTSKSNLAMARKRLRDLYPLHYATPKPRP